MSLPLSTPLGDAIVYLQKGVEKGVRCPCCSRYTKIYRRRINRAMAQALVNLFKAGQGYHHLPEMDPSKGDAAKLVHWGLIAEESVLRPDGGRAGYWRITNDGIKYVMGLLRVSEYAVLYNNVLLGLEGAKLSIHDAWGHPFDLRELM